jgi:hypothetical protein
VNDHLRIGDAEREEAARELGEHFALGRITADEHAERLEQIWAARTAADLAPVFGDLPRPRPEQPPPTTGDRIRSLSPRLPYLPMPFRLLCFVLLFILAVTHLPIVVVALLVYVLAVRRVAARRRTPWHGHARWR